MLTMKPIDGQSSSSDGPFQQPRRPQSTMDQFDRLVLKAAKHKRKEIINRYGDEGCSKLMARKTKQDQQQLLLLQKKDDDESVKVDYEKTIEDLKAAQKILNSSCHSHLSKENQSPNTQKKEQRRTPVHAEETNNDDDDDDNELDIDKLFELAWGNDISPACSKLTDSSSTLATADSTPDSSPRYSKPRYKPPATSKPRYSPTLKIKKTRPINNNNNDDEIFAKNFRFVSKLLKARETKTPKVRRVPSKDKHPGSLAWQWNMEGYAPKSEKPMKDEVNRSGWQWNLS